MNGFAFKIISGGKEHVGGSNTLYANVKTERGALQRLAQSILPPGQYNMYVVRDGVWSAKPTVVYKRAKQNPRRKKVMKYKHDKLMRRRSNKKRFVKRVVKKNPTRPILRAARRVQRVPAPVPVGKHVCVEVDGRTVMQSKDTPELRALALRYARTLKRKHRSATIKVIAQ